MICWTLSIRSGCCVALREEKADLGYIHTSSDGQKYDVSIREKQRGLLNILVMEKALVFGGGKLRFCWGKNKN